MTPEPTPFDPAENVKARLKDMEFIGPEESVADLRAVASDLRSLYAVLSSKIDVHREALRSEEAGLSARIDVNHRQFLAFCEHMGGVTREAELRIAALEPTFDPPVSVSDAEMDAAPPETAPCGAQMGASGLGHYCADMTKCEDADLVEKVAEAISASPSTEEGNGYMEEARAAIRVLAAEPVTDEDVERACHTHDEYGGISDDQGMRLALADFVARRFGK